MIIQEIVAPASSSSDTLAELRTRVVQIFASVSLMGIALGLPFQLISSLSAEEKLVRVAIAIIFGLLLAALLYLVRVGRIRQASFLTVLTSLGGTLVMLFLPGWFILGGIITVIGAVILVPTPVFLAAVVAVLGMAAINVLFQSQGGSQAELTTSILLFLILLVVAAMRRFFIGRLEHAFASTQRVNRLLGAVAGIGERLSRSLKVSELLPDAVELIRERFDYYHVQVFLLDERGEVARLAASTGEVGQLLLERQHRLAVGSRSVIGRVTASRVPVIARDTDPFYFRNELLPQTRSELALPVFDGDRLIGALDVQSQRQGDFTPEVVRAMQVLASLLGTSIRNARLFEEQESSTKEARRLLTESERNLREIQRLNQMLTHSGWEGLLGGARVRGIQLAEAAVEPAGGWTPAQLESMQSLQPVQDMRDGVSILAVPIILADQPVGAIEVETPTGTPDRETVEMLKSVAQRMALSLDKARLFEEAQEQAAREQQINAIVSRFQTVSSVDELLRITLTEMARSLGAQQASIRLAVGELTTNGDRPS